MLRLPGEINRSDNEANRRSRRCDIADLCCLYSAGNSLFSVLATARTFTVFLIAGVYFSSESPSINFTIDLNRLHL